MVVGVAAVQRMGTSCDVAAMGVELGGDVAVGAVEMGGDVAGVGVEMGGGGGGDAEAGWTQ